MSDEIHIVVQWKQSGGSADFRRPDLLARYLREHLPRVLFRVDLEGRQLRHALAEEYVADLRARMEIDPLAAGVAAVIAAAHDKPPGWDDYYLTCTHDVRIP